MNNFEIREQKILYSWHVWYAVFSFYKLIINDKVFINGEDIEL